MSAFQHDCPFCNTKQAGFQLIGNIKSFIKESHWDATARCGVCKNLVLVTLDDIGAYSGGGGANDSPIDFSKNATLEKRFRVFKFLPKPNAVTCPEYVPENIKTAYIEAETALNASLYSSAAAG